MRTTIEIRGAKEHNLKNIDVEIPRDQLVVLTGMSGSGKSSLAFDTLYAEGQRRFLESLSAWAKRFVQQLKKPAVDFVYGLSPVISIEQKTVSRNPRSTVGTMTDISDYLRILFATAGTAHCAYCEREVPIRTANQLVEHLLALPEGTPVEICAPVFPVYGEDLSYLFAEIRTKGCRRVRIDEAVYDLSDEIEVDEEVEHRMEAIVDRFVVKKELYKQLMASIQSGLVLGEGFLRFRISDFGFRIGDGEQTLRTDRTDRTDPTQSEIRNPKSEIPGACPEHHVVMGEIQPYYFTFNEMISACVTCLGLGTYLSVHPDLLVPDKGRSIRGGAFVSEAFRYDKNTWGGRIMTSMAEHYGFSLDTPFRELPAHIVDILLHGSHGERFPMVVPEGATKGDQHAGKLFRFDGIATQIERRYRRYRKEQVAHSGMETYLRKVMVEHTCPDCRGTRLKKQRLLVTLNGRNIHELGELNIGELKEFLEALVIPERQREAAGQVIQEICSRLDLLMGIGVDYLSLNRRSATLSGGESQRIRLSTQIGSGLMGMMYVLDEPSIGLHPRDNTKMIATLRRLRDIGNSVVVVEHDEETIRAADHILEMGPGPGIHGGKVVAQGTLEEILRCSESLTGQYLSGCRRIEVPRQRRSPNGKCLRVLGARENNLNGIDVEIPLGMFVCITGVSGSGKSTLVNEILYKRLYAHFHDSRVLSGAHEAIEGIAHLTDVINIDQTAIGRTSRSNPATYIGFYDNIREIFASLPESRERGYTASRFSFNVKGGRCEECGGEGTITTHLHLMPDVETPCQTCKGARYNEETLEIAYEGRSIADVLDLTCEEGAAFFARHSLVAHKIGMLDALGLGYLTLGQSSTTLSGGEAQRIKLAKELGKIKRGAHNFYILDEPTTGLHLADIQRLLDSLNRLVEAGNSVLVIEHHMDVIKTADHVIDLGPEGGHRGGNVIACGTPEEVARVPGSFTGQYLQRHFAGGSNGNGRGRGVAKKRRA